jgi:hypothetical protein
MFTPSLVAMIAQSLLPRMGEREPRNVSAEDTGELFRRYVAEWQQRDLGPFPELPVLGRTRNFMSFSRELGNRLPPREFSNTKEIFFFGRVPIDVLVERLYQTSDIHADQEIFELGTPLRNAHAGGGSSSTCSQLFPHTNAAARVRVAVIDRGIASTQGSPEDYQGKLTHVIATGILMSPHAENVYGALLDRLDLHGILPDVDCYCALVAPPGGSGIGNACFTHANSVDLLNAVRTLDSHLGNGGLPVVLNLSLGTHVGPHNGQSALEEFIHQTWSAKSQRYLHVAAGNDGGKGIASRREVFKDIEETLPIRTGPYGGHDLLVELWWSDAANTGPPDIQAEIFDGTGRPLGLSCRLLGGSSGATLALIPSRFTGLSCQSLFHAQAYGSMHCVAFALHANQWDDLKNLEIMLTLKAKSDAVVHGWIVIADDSRSCFIEGGSVGSLCVPATEEEALAVSGVEASDQPWAPSSRGPLPSYGPHSVAMAAPHVAHLVDLGVGNEKGTSYASPRACADSALLVRDATVRKRCNTAQDLAQELLNKFGATRASTWSNRIGFGSLK